MNYLPLETEVRILLARAPHHDTQEGIKRIQGMVAMAQLTRSGFRAGDISTVMSPRTLMTWLTNYDIFQDNAQALKFAFLNRCDESEYEIFAEYYQRCFNNSLDTTHHHDTDEIKGNGKNHR